MSGKVIRVRSDDEIAAVRELVWELFDFLRMRYAEAHATIDAYIEDQGIAHELENFGDFFLPRTESAFLPSMPENQSAS